MNRQDISIAIARHKQFIERATRMIEADGAGDPLPETDQFHQQEVQGLDSSTGRLVRDVLGRSPSDDEWQAPGAYSIVHHPKNETIGWVKAYRGALQTSKNYLEALLSAVPTK